MDTTQPPQKLLAFYLILSSSFLSSHAILAGLSHFLSTSLNHLNEATKFSSFSLPTSLSSLFSLSLSLTSARLIVPRQGEMGVEASDMAHAWSSKDLKDDIETLGSEECDEKDAECSSRRMVAEAHLNNIHAQNLKP